MASRASWSRLPLLDFPGAEGNDDGAALSDDDDGSEVSAVDEGIDVGGPRKSAAAGAAAAPAELNLVSDDNNDDLFGSATSSQDEDGEQQPLDIPTPAPNGAGPQLHPADMRALDSALPALAFARRDHRAGARHLRVSNDDKDVVMVTAATPKDGKCLYHAIARAATALGIGDANGRPSDHHSLRSETARLMLLEEWQTRIRQHLSPAVDELLLCHRARPGFWMAPDGSEWPWAMVTSDRIDNRLWYVEGNLRLVLRAHNTVRGPSNHDESWVCWRAHFDRRLIVREAKRRGARG